MDAKRPAVGCRTYLGVAMKLNIRAMPFEIPSYSLTGDILSYQRCGLQYRYYNGSSLPPSRPVQMWTGEFVHGVLEEAYREWELHRPGFPWPMTQTGWPAPSVIPARSPHDIGVLGDRVEARLTAGGKKPRSGEARDSAYRRVEAAVNVLGPHLFPLITAAEERISGTRDMPRSVTASHGGRGDRYELTGVVDVISSVRAGSNTSNPVIEVIQPVVPPFATEYDLIVDYKAARRPDRNSRFWSHHEWQVQTYAWLRRHTPSARPVGAGLIIYINELSPSKTDLEAYKREVSKGTADIVPANGSADYYELQTYRSGGRLPNFSVAFRLQRAVRVIDVATHFVDVAVGKIDGVVSTIEQSAQVEFNTGNIPNNWTACGDEEDCVACDFRHFCPRPAPARRPAPPPDAPG